MHKKFNNLTNELNDIIIKLNNVPKLTNITSKELQDYKSLVIRKEALQKKINTLLNKRALIIGKYNDTNRLLGLTSMNCRKYCKLEQSAAYSRDLALYKLGFLDSKPLLPFIQNSKKFISENIMWKLSNKTSGLRDGLHGKLESYKKYIEKKSPIYKSIIKSVKKIKYQSFTRNTTYSTPITTLAYIVSVENSQSNAQQNEFRRRIQVTPTTTSSKPIVHTKNAERTHSDYTLAL